MPQDTSTERVNGRSEINNLRHRALFLREQAGPNDRAALARASIYVEVSDLIERNEV